MKFYYKQVIEVTFGEGHPRHGYMIHTAGGSPYDFAMDSSFLLDKSKKYVQLEEWRVRPLSFDNLSGYHTGRCFDYMRAAV